MTEPIDGTVGGIPWRYEMKYRESSKNIHWIEKDVLSVPR